MSEASFNNGIAETCEECRFCKEAMRFSYEPTIREDNRVVIQENRKRMGYMDVCIKDLDHIKQIHGYDSACEEAEV